MSCFSFLFKKKEASLVKLPVEIDEVVSGVLNVKQYTYKELQIATENFSKENKIGQGGFGSVYKGTLKDGTLAAIKVLSAESSQGLREFLTEIEVIATVEHDSLVKLYGCCAEADHRILVYGYLENNSLAQTLLGRGYSGIQFTWPTRCKICIGVARGLAYLHEEAWEHHQKEQLVELVDASLNGNFDVEEACRFLKIGLLCIQDMPKLRPSMSTVVQMLTGALDVNEGQISKPGLLSEFMEQRECDREKAKAKNPSYTISASGRFMNSSSSSETATTSFATMTFNSIYDRSN
ncbi:hypothetical protein C1H46_004030 [Malus baccata]|uniref:Protein kinase domain-containing protein n=1 Tax=Malus baccata TaxID=106549 RepID=A0A540NGY9_MALBA|nr:hypothetical protein C1H46_004030 [Malus baccata]